MSMGLDRSIDAIINSKIFLKIDKIFNTDCKFCQTLFQRHDSSHRIDNKS